MKPQCGAVLNVEPVLITYNRQAQLERTLSAFLASEFSRLPFHVLDNASTDNTADVVAAFTARWPTLKYHRNKYNIGGNGNILRAVEITDSEYAWVIGDDDTWFLDDLSDLSETLSMKTADIIRLGWLISPGARGRLVDARRLIEEERFFFASVSMISATIIRRSLVLPYLAEAYMNIGDAYPQWVPIMRALEAGPLQVYSVKRDLMIHVPSTQPGYFFGDLEWYVSWYRCGRFIGDARLRRRFIGECLRYMTRNREGRLNEILWLVKVALNYKALGVAQGRYLMSMLAYGDGQRFTILFALLVYRLVPRFVARLLRHFYQSINRLPDKPLVRDRSRL